MLKQSNLLLYGLIDVAADDGVLTGVVSYSRLSSSRKCRAATFAPHIIYVL